MAENNGSLAEVQLTVAVDKKKYFNQLKKMFQDSQTECDANALTITFKNDKATIEQIVKELDNYDFSANVTLDSNVEELKGHLEDVLKNWDMSVPVTADTSELDKKLAEEKKKLEEMKKNQLKSADEYKKQMQKLAKDTESASASKSEKAAIELLKVYKLFEQVGGRFGKDDKELKAVYDWAATSANLKKAHENPIKIFSTEEIEQQIQLIKKLEQEIEEAKIAARSGVGGTGTGSGNGNAKINTTPEVNPTEFANKVTEQLITPAEIKVEGIVSDADEFAKKVTEQLTIPAEIKVDGVVSNPKEFADNVSKQLTIPATIDITASDNRSSSTPKIEPEDKIAINFYETLKRENQIRDESNNVLKNFNASLKDTAAYLYDVNNQEERMIMLQGKMQVGDTLVQGNGHVGVSYDIIDSLRPDTLAHSHQFDKAFNNLRFSTDDLAKATARDFINRLVLSCGEQMLEFDFAGIDPQQREQMIRQMSETYTSVFALYGAAVKEDGTLGNPKDSLDPKVYNQAVEVINSMMYEIAQSFGANFAKYNASDFGNESKIVPFKPVSSTISKYISSMGLALGDNNTAGIAKLQSDFAEETAKATKKAASGIDAEAKAAKDAIKWKKEFAKANNIVAQASEETAEKTKEAAAGIETEEDASKKAADSTKSFKSNPDLLRYLKDIQRGTNTIPFSIAIDKEMAEAELKKVAPEIADAFNKQYGTSITSSQVVKAYKASLKEQQAADEAALQAHLELMEKRAQADNEVFQEQVRKWAEYTQRAEDDRQVRAYEDSMAYSKQQEADELEYQKKLAEYKANGAAQAQKIIQEEKEYAAWIDEVTRKQKESIKTEAIREKVLQEEQKIRRAEGDEIRKQRQIAAQTVAKQDADKETSALAAQEKAYRNILSIRAQIEALKLKGDDSDSTIQNLQEQLKIQQKIYGQASLQIKAVNDEYNVYERLKELRKITSADAAKADSKVANAEDLARKADEQEKAGKEKEIRDELNKSYKRSRDILDEINRLRIANLALDENDLVEQNKLAENRKQILKLYQDLYKEAGSRSVNQYNTDALEEELQLYRQDLNVKLQNAQVEQELKQAKDESTQKNKAAAKAYDKLYSSAKEYYSLLMKESSGALYDNERIRLTKLKSEWASATDGVGKYSIAVDGSTDSIVRATSAMERFINESQSTSVNGVLKGLQTSYDRIQTMIGSGKYTTAFVSELAKVQGQIREIQNTPIDLDDSVMRQKLQTLQRSIDETIGKKAFSDVKKAASSSLSKLELQINQFTTQNTGMGLKFKQQFENLRIRLTDAKSIADVEKLAGSIIKLKSEVEAAGKATRSFFDILRERIVGINAQAIAQYFSWQDWIRYIRQMATTVTQLDTALTGMRKVSDDSLSSLKAYQQTTFEIADTVGTTALALQQSTVDWMRLGEAQKEAAESAKAATVLMNVSEFQSIDEATQSLVAVSQAYKDIDKMDIIDVINNIGNNYSVATDELAQGLQNAAAVLRTQGNDLNEAVALLTAGNAITQDISKTSAGIRTISLRIAGTQEAKDQLAELGEEVDDFIVQTESKTQKIIKDYTSVASNAYKGIDVLDANGNLRNTYDILLDIAKIYKEIQDEDRKAGTNRAQALVEYIAGKNRSNIAASILLNPEMLENVYNSAIDSAGSAEEELSKYLDSIEGHVARFQTQLQELEFDFLDSDTIKTFIDLGTGALSVIDSIVESLGLLGTLGIAASIAAATRNFGVFRTTLDETSESGLQFTTIFNELATALEDSQEFAFSDDYSQSISDAIEAFQEYNASVEAGTEPQEAFNRILATGNDELIEYAAQYGASDEARNNFLHGQAQTQVALMAENTSLSNVSSLIQGYNNSLAITGLEQNEFAAAVMASNSSLGQYLRNLNGAQASMSGYLSSVIRTTAATVALRAITMALNAGIGMVVSWLIGKAIQAFDNYIHRVENAKKALDEFDAKSDELQASLKKQRDAIDELSDSYFNLAKGVDSVTGKNLSLSSDEYDEFVKTNQTFAELFPHLISGVDAYGRYILDLGDNADEARKKLEKLYNQEVTEYNYSLYSDLPTTASDANTAIKDAQKRANAAKTTLNDIAELTTTIKDIAETTDDSMTFVASYADEATLRAVQNLEFQYSDLVKSYIGRNNELAQKLTDAFTTQSTDTGIITTIQMDKLSEEERKLVRDYFNDYVGEVSKQSEISFKKSSQEATAALQKAEGEINAAWLKFRKGIVGGIGFLSNDERITDMLTGFVNQLPAEVAEQLSDVDIQTEIAKWISDVEKLDGAQKLQLNDLINGELDPRERLELYNKLQPVLNEMGLTLPVELIIKDDRDLVNRVRAASNRLSKFVNQFGVEETNVHFFDDFFEEMSIDAEEEYERWIEIANSSYTAAEAMRKYRDWVSQAVKESSEITPNLVSAATTLNTKIKPATDALAELYKELFYGGDGKNATGAFDISKLDPSQLAGIKENLVTNLKDLGIEFKDAEEKVNDFFTALSDPKADKTTIQNAFNKLLTEYFYAADGLSDLTEETADGLKKMLTGLNVTNADEVIEKMLVLKKVLKDDIDEAVEGTPKIKKAFEDINNIDFDLKIADATKALDTEALEKYTELKEKAAEGTIKLTDLTADEISFLEREGIIAGTTAQALAILALRQQLVNGVDISTSQSVEALAALATQAGIDIAELTVLNKILSLIAKRDEAVAAGVGADAAEYSRQIDALKSNMVAEIQNALGNIQLGLKFAPENTSSAGSAGKDAGDAYVEQFEKELEKLKNAFERGEITHSEYLDRWKALIIKYFAGIDKYAEEYANRMKEYYDEAISYMESVVSAIGTLLDKKISVAEEGKEAAISAIEAEKEAALAAYDAQLEAIDELIKAKQDEIDAVQDEIDKLQEEHDARKRNIDLQKAQYELQKAQQQRTKLQYVDGQMVYRQDPDAIRNAKEQVEEAEYEIAIAALEKQKELLEDQLEALQEQREAIEKARESAEKYYDSLISSTEKYWDQLIKSLEKQKSKWSELVEQKEIAEAFAIVQEQMRQFGFTVEDVLNDTPGAFEAFKNAYLGTLSEANAKNKDFLDGLDYATKGVSTALSSIAQDAGGAADAIKPLGDIAGTVSDTAEALDKVATSSGTAASNTSTLSTNSETLGKNLSAVTDAADGIEKLNLTNATNEFKNLADAIGNVTKALGVDEDGTVGSLQKAITELSSMTFADDSGIIGAFNKLTGAVGTVTAAIGGGASTTKAAESQEGETSEGTEDAASTLNSAITKVKETADTYIGQKAEDDSGATAISDFNMLKNSVQSLCDKIGVANESGEVAEDSLLGVIKSLPEEAEPALIGEGGLKSMFDELLTSIEGCASAAAALLSTIQGLESSKTFGIAPPINNTEATGNVHIGNAYADGKLGIKSPGNALVGEAGQELIVDSSSGKYRLTHGPEITKLDKGDLVFNAEQTKAIIKNGMKDDGHSYANGTGGLIPLSAEEKNLFKTMGNALIGIRADVNSMLAPVKSMAQKATTASVSPVINISGTQFTVQGVTGESVCHIIQNQFANIVANAYQHATKR